MFIGFYLAGATCYLYEKQPLATTVERRQELMLRYPDQDTHFA